MLEVCTDSIAGLLECIRGKAGRVEICSALSEGGITPSSGEMLMAERLRETCLLGTLASTQPTPHARMLACGQMPLGHQCHPWGTNAILHAGFIKRAVALAPPELPVYVLIRPRGGDFLYDEEEVLLMEADVKMAGVLGAAGVVIGCLAPDGTVDEAATKRLMAVAKQSVRRLLEAVKTGSSPSLPLAYELCSDPSHSFFTHIRTHTLPLTHTL